VLRALGQHKALQINPLKSLLSVQEDAVFVAANVDMPVHPIGFLGDVQTTEPSVELREGYKHNRSLGATAESNVCPSGSRQGISLMGVEGEPVERSSGQSMLAGHGANDDKRFVGVQKCRFGLTDQIDSEMGLESVDTGFMETRRNEFRTLIVIVYLWFGVLA